MSRVYCKDCNHWSALPIDTLFSVWCEGRTCHKVIVSNLNHPVNPVVKYGNYNELNEDGNCEHYLNGKQASCDQGKPKPERAQVLYDLLREWNTVDKKSNFAHGGLTAKCINDLSMHGGTYGATVMDGDKAILKTRKRSYGLAGPPIKPASWRTPVYDNSYSDRIDDLMDALRKAIETEETQF